MKRFITFIVTLIGAVGTLIGGLYAAGIIGGEDVPREEVAIIEEVAITRTLSIYVSGQGTTSPSPGRYTYDGGQRVTITATPSSGYSFDHWGGDASGTSPSVTITVDRNKSVTAYFIKSIVYLSTSVSPSGSGRVSPSGGRFEEGSVVTLTATPSSGYRFDH